MRKFQCENCGAAMTIDEEGMTATCEYCGTTISIPDTYPEYTEALFEKRIEELEQENEIAEDMPPRKMIKTIIMVIIGIVLVTSVSIIACEFVLFSTSSFSEESVDIDSLEYNWPVSGNAALLPEPISENGEITSNSESHFSAVVYNVSQDEFDSYASECRENGFDIAVEGSDSSYYAYNADGYCVDLFYWKEESELSIYLDAPEEITELIWPATGLAAELPKPDSDLGRVIYEDSEGISVVVYVDSKNEFDLYVEDCKKQGYTENQEFYFMDSRNDW